LEGLDELIENIANQTFHNTVTKESAGQDDGKASSPVAGALAK
jgi:hypothetical protein